MFNHGLRFRSVPASSKIEVGAFALKACYSAPYLFVGCSVLPWQVGLAIGRISCVIA